MDYKFLSYDRSFDVKLWSLGGRCDSEDVLFPGSLLLYSKANLYADREDRSQMVFSLNNVSFALKFMSFCSHSQKFW